MKDAKDAETVKSKVLPEHNYSAYITKSGKVLRFAIDNSKPITPLLYPDLEDWAITSKCFGNCPYCYVSAVKEGKNFDNIIDKLHSLYYNVDDNLKPFQVAIGGAGEPTLHPDFIEFIKTTKEYGIIPNYTTNGMHLTDDILDATQKHCGAVAITYHPHLLSVFEKAYKQLQSITTTLNIHYILGQPNSFESFKNLYNTYNKTHYFVVLPYQSTGRATPINVEEEYTKFFNNLNIFDNSKIALGALFFNYIKKYEIALPFATHQPDIFSGYRIFDDSYQLLRISSYNMDKKI